MARKPVVLITGANGEVGHGLVHRLSAESNWHIVALDLAELEPSLALRCNSSFTGSILDRRLLDRLVSEFEIQAIFHLAALLSSRGEFIPEAAHEVNVDGTIQLLRLAAEQARSHGHRVRFLFPSSIAVYGLPPGGETGTAGKIKEEEFNEPITMYGCNKLYCEHLGRYYTRHYRQLAADSDSPGVDFRAVRFPGLLSAETVPSGGTSDYGPEMVHAAAKGSPYSSFVRENSTMPFMAMPDAIDALMELMRADPESLSRTAYNITGFSPSAEEFAAKARSAFPGAEISFDPDPKRQAIVDTWPNEVDDSRARKDWGFAPHYDFDRCFDEYLIPGVRRRYS